MSKYFLTMALRQTGDLYVSCRHPSDPERDKTAKKIISYFLIILAVRFMFASTSVALLFLKTTVKVNYPPLFIQNFSMFCFMSILLKQI